MLRWNYGRVVFVVALALCLTACGTKPTAPSQLGSSSPPSQAPTSTPPEDASGSVISAGVDVPSRTTPSNGGVIGPFIADEGDMPVEPTATMQELIERGEVVVNGNPLQPCYNAQALLDFYNSYEAKTECTVDIYRFRTNAEGDEHYAVTTLTVTRKANTVTVDTTYDIPPGGAYQGAQIATLGSFQCSKNRYGHLLVDVQSEDGPLRLSYQVERYEDLFPSIPATQTEYEMYMEPILYTGLLQKSWESATQLAETEGFPFVFDAMAGEAMQDYYTQYWDEEERVYRFPQTLVEETVLLHFDLTARQLRRFMHGYNKESMCYDNPGRPGASPQFLRIVQLSREEAKMEDIHDVVYEIFDPTTGEPNLRGQLRVSVDGEGGYYYLSNKVTFDRDNPEL